MKTLRDEYPLRAKMLMSAKYQNGHKMRYGQVLPFVRMSHSIGKSFGTHIESMVIYEAVVESDKFPYSTETIYISSSSIELLSSDEDSSELFGRD